MIFVAVLGLGAAVWMFWRSFCRDLAEAIRSLP